MYIYLIFIVSFVYFRIYFIGLFIYCIVLFIYLFFNIDLNGIPREIKSAKMFLYEAHWGDGVHM